MESEQAMGEIVEAAAKYECEQCQEEFWTTVDLRAAPPLYVPHLDCKQQS
ncbi:hypothetical protein [Streptomyces alboflavus]|nr:hypothetical protein [Streptomyces alboflavus]